MKKILARQSAEEQVRNAVESFYAAFNAHDFARAAEFTTDDWEHINPFGGWTRGREEVLKELREVHGSFLKGVNDTVESMSVRLTAPSSAAVTVISHMDTYVTPDGVRHENERHVRTFIVVTLCAPSRVAASRLRRATCAVSRRLRFPVRNG